MRDCIMTTVNVNYFSLGQLSLGYLEYLVQLAHKFVLAMDERRWTMCQLLGG